MARIETAIGTPNVTAIVWKIVANPRPRSIISGVSCGFFAIAACICCCAIAS